MSQKQNPLSTIAPWDLVACGYAETTMHNWRITPKRRWAPLDQSPAMQMMFGALKAIKPDLPEPQRAVTTLENPDVFKQELLNAGFRDVKIQCITKAAFPVESIAVFWGDMVKGSAPIQMLKKSMGETAWLEQEILAIKYLEENLPSVPTTLSSDAMHHAYA